jgi:hypothetical protein
VTDASTFILYTRADCHLCETAAVAMDRLGLRWRAVDIDSDPALEKEFGLLIPVVRHPHTGRRLCFPFDENRLAGFAEEGS